MTYHRVLVRGVNWLGDAVMTMPALQRLREFLPQSTITLLTHEKLAALWQNYPHINEVLTFKAGETPWQIADRLRSKQFELAMVFPNSPRSALEVWHARIPQRIGYARSWRNFFLTQAIPVRHADMKKLTPRQVRRLVAVESRVKETQINLQPAKAPTSLTHHVHVYLRLVAAMGASAEPVRPVLAVDEDELQKVKARWLSSTTPGRLFGINPSAAYGPAKRWPVENFAATIDHISKRVGQCHWIVFGGTEDMKLCEQISNRAGANVINVAGQTTLRELLALLKLCKVVITNDSGPMHVAAALGTPVVVPFGSTSPELTGPGLPGDPWHFLLRANVPCSPCFRRTCPIDLRCMTQIKIAQVAEAALLAISRQ
jgi:heptosyltransferase II